MGTEGLLVYSSLCKLSLSDYPRPPTMPELIHLKVPEHVGSVFFKFGVLLLDDENGAKMDSIRREYQEDSGLIVRMTLKQWVQGDGKPLTWETLIKTLRDCNVFGLAAEIEATKINGNNNCHSY